MTETNRKPCITHRLGHRSQTDHAIVYEYDPQTKQWTKEERPAEFGVRPQSVLRMTHDPG